MKVTPAFLLFAIFLVLKLTGYIGWSWWWITAPLWIPLPFVIAAVLFVAAVNARKSPLERHLEQRCRRVDRGGL